jgi:hypothetical protein
VNRRTLLARTGALGALALAGCLGDGTDDENTPADGAGDGDTPTPTPGEPTDTPAGPAVTDQSITTVDTRCQTGDATATVSADAEAGVVTVSGSLQTSTPCYRAVLETVSYDAASDALTIDVGAERTADTCIDCVGAVEYEATVAFADGLPGTVTVSHRGESVVSGDTADAPLTPADRPAIQSSSLSVTGVSESESRETATAEFDTDAKTVSLSGTIEGSDGCKTAALGAVEYDAASDTLAVDVVTRDREGTEDQACTQATIYIDYEATVTFSRGLPTAIEVSHDGTGIMSGAHGSASASAPDR